MRTLRSYLLPMLCALAAAAAAAGPPSGAAAAVPIRHVFIIVLENKGYETTFGSGSAAPYLARTLAGRGVLLTQYYGTGHFSLDNYLAMISGQAATPQTRDDCEIFADFVSSGTTADGQAIGHGCVYPHDVQTLPDQLSASGKTWRGYMEDMGNDPEREAATCGHPALNAPDPTQTAEGPSARVPRGDQYAARHDPFVYFHSIIDSPACGSHVVNLERLARDLGATRTTPNLAFIVPNLCHDGHDAPCKNGEPGGLRSADAFLRKWVPLIEASPAYRRDGLLVITFDEGDAEERPDGAGGGRANYPGQKCCDQQPGPNLAPFPQSVQDGAWTVNFQDFGGDRIGAVLLSPFLEAGRASATPFNHYSLLKTLEDVFGTRGHLGYAGQVGLVGLFDPAASDISVLQHARR
jgi:hypothetical protein